MLSAGAVDAQSDQTPSEMGPSSTARMTGGEKSFLFAELQQRASTQADDYEQLSPHGWAKICYLETNAGTCKP